MGQGRAYGRDDALLVGDRVCLRLLDEREHIAAWREWLDDPEVARWMEGDVGPAPLMYGIERVDDGALIGGVVFADVSEDRRAELVIAIGEADARGRGYGREAIGLALGHAFGRLRMREVFLRVRPDNRRAVRCYLACGFLPEGQLSRRVGGGPPRRVLLMSRRAG